MPNKMLSLKVRMEPIPIRHYRRRLRLDNPDLCSKSNIKPASRRRTVILRRAAPSVSFRVLLGRLFRRA